MPSTPATFIEDAPETFIPDEPLDFSKSLVRPGQLDASGQKPYAGYLSAGPFSPYQSENMQEAVDLISSLQEPPFRIPRIQGSSLLGKLAAAPVNVASGLAEGMISPAGAAATLAGGPVVKGLFAGLAAKEAGRALGEASVNKDPQAIAEGLIGAGVAPWIALSHTLPERIIPNASRIERPMAVAGREPTRPAAQVAERVAEDVQKTAEVKAQETEQKTLSPKNGNLNFLENIGCQPSNLGGVNCWMKKLIKVEERRTLIPTFRTHQELET